MVVCGKCQLQNSLDSSFCRKCGTGLDADLLQQAKSELGRTVAQGFVLFNEGKVEEAGLIAEMAVGEDPTLTTAISLKGMCHERKGELAEALASYEKVLEYAPDSALDRIKVSQLRAAISARASVVEDERAQPDKRLAFAVALAAVVFFSGVGALAFKLLSGAQTRTEQASNAKPTDTSVGQGFVDPTPATKSASTPAPSLAAPTATNSVSSTRPPEPSSNPAESPIVSRANDDGQNTTTNTLPSARPLGSDIVGLLPGTTNDVLHVTREPGSNPTPSKPVDPDPPVDNGPGKTGPGKTGQAPEQDPVEDPGQIEINVTNRTPKNVGGSQTVDDSSAAQNLGKIASQEFQLKRYDSAAKKYEKLLRSGGDAAHVNQRLAQCYENLGKKSDAVTAYQRAAKALKDNIDAGKGNVSREKAALETCQTAIKVLNEGA